MREEGREGGRERGREGWREGVKEGSGREEIYARKSKVRIVCRRKMSCFVLIHKKNYI